MLITAILIVLGTIGVALAVTRKTYTLLVTRRGLVGRTFVAVAGLGYGLPLALRSNAFGYLLTTLGMAASLATMILVRTRLRIVRIIR